VAFRERYFAALPPAAVDAIDRFVGLANPLMTGVDVNSLVGLKARLAPLAAFRAEVADHLSDRTAVAHRLSERACICNVASWRMRRYVSDGWRRSSRERQDARSSVPYTSCRMACGLSRPSVLEKRPISSSQNESSLRPSNPPQKHSFSPSGGLCAGRRRQLRRRSRHVGKRPDTHVACLEGWSCGRIGIWCSYPELSSTLLLISPRAMSATVT
jgi:hypothetical protein